MMKVTTIIMMIIMIIKIIIKIIIIIIMKNYIYIWLFQWFRSGMYSLLCSNKNIIWRFDRRVGVTIYSNIILEEEYEMIYLKLSSVFLCSCRFILKLKVSTQTIRVGGLVGFCQNAPLPVIANYFFFIFPAKS